MNKIINLKKFYKNKKILITGHTGFVGSWLSFLMLNFNCRLYGISKKNCKNSQNYQILSISRKFKKEFFIDINNFTLLEKKINFIKPDVIFHLAAQSYVLEGYNNPLDTFMTNIIGTANLLKSSIKNKVKHNIIITTDKCYVNENKKLRFKENSKLGGDDPYSASKACAEIISNSIAKSFSNKKIYIDTVRAGNILGGGDFGSNRLIPDIVLSKKRNENLTIRYPNAIRPWQNVLDVIIAYSLIPLNQIKRSKNFEAWNVGPRSREKTVRVIELVNNFLHSFNFKKKIIIKKSKIKEKEILILDSSKIRKHIKWDTQFKISETIEQICTWYKLYLTKNKKELLKYSNKLINDILKKI